MNDKFTPGPWKFHEQGEANQYALLTDSKRWIFNLQQTGQLWTEEQIANAKLICAAPELLEALREAQEELHRAGSYMETNDSDIVREWGKGMVSQAASIGELIKKATE